MIHRVLSSIPSLRHPVLTLVELAGVAIVVYGISLVSHPAAVIIAGLALIAVVEVRS